MSKNKNALGVVMLFLAALIWGLAFSAQSIGARYVNAYTFLAIRSWISFIAMIPVVYFFKKKNTGNSNKHTDKRAYKKTLFIASLCSGFFYFLQVRCNKSEYKNQTRQRRDLLPHYMLFLCPLFQ
ncbi:hypothetical protein HMPREF0491_02507 [Lachnospiraceae oral taxon 107 str. F0167]|nr:hypothetical protein HMPREF0491_02507 [Lachnospiraceae oral taxon 107 str. F0167]